MTSSERLDKLEKQIEALLLTSNNPSKKRAFETSKLLCYITGVWFILCSLTSFIIWTVIALKSGDGYSWIDCAVPAALVTTSGAIFGICLTGYYNMNRFVNVTKIKMHANRERILLLDHFNVLDADTEKRKLNESFDDLESTFSSEENLTTREVENPLSIT